MNESVLIRRLDMFESAIEGETYIDIAHKYEMTHVAVRKHIRKVIEYFRHPDRWEGKECYDNPYDRGQFSIDVLRDEKAYWINLINSTRVRILSDESCV